jgi:vitamin B12 transporter
MISLINAISFVMNLFKNIWLVGFVIAVTHGYAQQQNDPVFQLPQVEINTSRIDDFSSGSKLQQLDSSQLALYATNNLADLLSNESPVFIKSYGLGSLATTSFRGGSASHTAVLWNGFNINSPMNGTLDLSLIPVSFIGKTTLQYGGSSALWGSGAVGGTIHLNSQPQFNDKLSVLARSSFASFDNYQQQVQLQWGKKRWSSGIKLFNHTAQNNFPFYNTSESSAVKTFQSNAQLTQQGILSENYFKINNYQLVNLCAWIQHNDRNIPPTFLQQYNNTNQQDKTYRLTSQWQRTGKGIADYYVRAAWFNEQLIYTDNDFSFTSKNNANSFISEAESKIKLKQNHLLNIGINNTFTTARANGYANDLQQNRVALFSSYRYNTSNQKLRTTLSLRQELFNSKLIPLTYSAGAEYKLFAWLELKVNAAKVYRIPTFNDLYWTPGGNPNLKPESGYTQDAGLLLRLNLSKRITFSTEPTVFNRNMNNWILWTPTQGFWSPQNIMEVWSRGMETKNELKYTRSKFVFKINVLTNYVVSTSEKPISPTDMSLHKQLIYVPMYSGQGKATVEYKHFSIGYIHTYTGYRFTSTDNTEYLMPFYIANVFTSYNMVVKKYAINVFAQVNNIYNEQYQVILNRPMPMVNYQAGFSIKYQ